MLWFVHQVRRDGHVWNPDDLWESVNSVCFIFIVNSDENFGVRALVSYLYVILMRFLDLWWAGGNLWLLFRFGDFSGICEFGWELRLWRARRRGRRLCHWRERNRRKMRLEAWGGGLGPPLPQGLIAFERKTPPAALTSAGSAQYVYFLHFLRVIYQAVIKLIGSILTYVTSAVSI